MIFHQWHMTTVTQKGLDWAPQPPASFRARRLSGGDALGGGCLTTREAAAASGKEPGTQLVKGWATACNSIHDRLLGSLMSGSGQLEKRGQAGRDALASREGTGTGTARRVTSLVIYLGLWHENHCSITCGQVWQSGGGMMGNPEWQMLTTPPTASGTQWLDHPWWLLVV